MIPGRPTKVKQRVELVFCDWFKNDISVLNAAVNFFKPAVVGYVIHNGLFRAVAVPERNLDKNGAVRLNLFAVLKSCCFFCYRPFAEV